MKRVLVVDDEPHVTRLVRLRLETDGYTVQTASDGVEALERLAESQFDAVVTDYNMPRMNGQELCQAIGERFPGSPMTVFLVTARVDMVLREWASGMPRIEYLEKPLSLRQLASRLEESRQEAEVAVGASEEPESSQ